MSVVLRRTVGDDIDWRFYNLSGSHIQSQVICITSVDNDTQVLYECERSLFLLFVWCRICFFLYIHEGMHTILNSIFAPYYLKVLVGQFSFAYGSFKSQSVLENTCRPLICYPANDEVLAVVFTTFFLRKSKWVVTDLSSFCPRYPPPPPSSPRQGRYLL